MALHYKQKKQDSIPDIIKDMMFVHMIFIASSNRLPSNSTLNMREEDEYIFPISSKAEKKFYSSNTTNLDEFLIKNGICSRNQEDKLQYDQHLTILANEWNAVYAYRERLANPIKRKSEEESMEWVEAKVREAQELQLQEWQEKAMLLWTQPTPNPTDPTQPMAGESTEAYILRMQSLRTWTSTTSSQSA